MHKPERECWLRGPDEFDMQEGLNGRRIAGIDVGSEAHVIAVVDANGGELHRATAFGEDAVGYRRVRELLGEGKICLSQ
jgi:hypothetical protein